MEGYSGFALHREIGALEQSLDKLLNSIASGHNPNTSFPINDCESTHTNDRVLSHRYRTEEWSCHTERSCWGGTNLCIRIMQQETTLDVTLPMGFDLYSQGPQCLHFEQAQCNWQTY